MRRTRTPALLAAALLVAWAVPAAPPRPNVLVILTDDLGFSDVGCYGGEIDTPQLDRLAANGLRFSQFYNTAKCHSSRVSLLSGRWCRQAGDESLRRAAILPEILGKAGYFTAMTGKWHLQKQPTDFGFQRYFGHLSGACDYYLGDRTFRLNGEPWTVPDQGFYTTVANVDYALRFLAEARQTRHPWFLYIAFNAPHAPLQPLEADYRKYLGRFDTGWDVANAARLAKQTRLNLFGRPVEPAPRPSHIPAWESLPAETRAWESRRMAAYAALVDRVDQELGRLLADLERAGELDNTIIVFLSDNGACPYDRRSTGRDQEPYAPGVRWSDSTGWAWARNAPFRYYKQNQYEGGVATPAIVHWPAGLRTPPGAVVHDPAHLVDLLPTLAALAGAELPQTWPERELTPLAGVSLVPVLEGRGLGARPPIHFLFGTDRGLRDGEWKLVSFRSQPWELYNLAEDRCELRNVADRHPDQVARLVQLWHRMAAEVLMTPERERAPVAAAATGHQHREWTDFTAAPQAEAAPQGPAAGRRGSLRARVGTRLEVDGARLVLRCEGDDPGLAIDALPAMADAGPYTLAFRLQSRATGGAEVYWTTDPRTKLPQGSRLAVDVTHDGEWHTVSIAIPEPKALHALRLDPCGGPGLVVLEGLTLKDAAGGTIATWP